MLNEISKYCTEANEKILAVLIDDIRNFAVLYEIASDARRAGINSIILNAGSVSFPDTGEISLFQINKEDTRGLVGPRVVVSIDNILCFPKEIAVISIPHTMGGQTELSTAKDFEWYSFLTLWSDYAFLPQVCLRNIVAQEIEQVFSDVFPAPCAFPRSKDVYSIIPGGYLKLDYLAKEIERAGHSKNAVVIAPNRMSNCPIGYVEFCSRLITLVLTRFADYCVIFRPHPANRASEEVEAILAAFESSERVTIDVSPTNAYAFSRAALLITDSSTTAGTFTLATGIPHINYLPREEVGRVEHELGFTTYTLEQVAISARTVLCKESALFERVKIAADKRVLNRGSAYQKLTESIKKIFQDETSTGWLTFSRKFADGDWESEETWYDFIEHSTTSTNLLLRYARKHFPDSQAFPNLPSWQTAAVRINYSSSTMEVIDGGAIADYKSGKSILPTYAIWGTGGNYEDNYRQMVKTYPAKFLGFYDNNTQKCGTLLDGYPIVPSDQLGIQRPTVLFIASVFTPQIILTIKRLLSLTVISTELE